MNNSAPKFAIRRTYNQRILKEQAKYIAYDEEGTKIVYHNPIDGVGEAKTTKQPRAPSTNKNNPNPTGFRMKKTIYSITDR